MADFAFCHGYTVDPNGYSEIVCKRRAYCAYYQEDFYTRFRGQLDNFEEMFPFEPCQYFVKKEGVVEEEDKNEELFESFIE